MWMFKFDILVIYVKEEWRTLFNLPTVDYKYIYNVYVYTTLLIPPNLHALIKLSIR